MLASELEDRIGEGVVHANMATTHEMLCNLEETLIHREKVGGAYVSVTITLLCQESDSCSILQWVMLCDCFLLPPPACPPVSQ